MQKWGHKESFRAVGGGLPMGRIRSRQGGGEVITVKTER